MAARRPAPAQDPGPAVRAAGAGRDAGAAAHPQGRRRWFGRGPGGRLSKIDVGDEVDLRVIDRGVGAITETNVSLAAASDAVIVGFNVRPQGKATELAEREGVEHPYYSVIYAAIDEIEAALKACSSRSTRRPPSAGGDPRDLPLVPGGHHRRLHGHQRHHPPQREGRLLRRVSCCTRAHRLAAAGEGRRHRGPRGFECGITLANYSDIRVGDIIETSRCRRSPHVTAFYRERHRPWAG
jgi:translation initiation factor IF-2